MYKISSYNPIFFSPSTDSGGYVSRYIQEFACSDRIMIQVIGYNTSVAPQLVLHRLLPEKSYKLAMRVWQINSLEKLFYVNLVGIEPGMYYVELAGSLSDVFYIKEQPADTVLLQYSNRGNVKTKDAVFYIENVQHFFDFRIPGGFKDQDWMFGVENEQYTTSDNDVIDVYSYSFSMKKLTIGNSRGCPVWYAELVNRLLSCDFVYIDGVRYGRYESNVPEMTVLLEGYKSFVFKQVLRRIENLDPEIEERNRLLMMRTTGTSNRFVSDNIRILK